MIPKCYIYRMSHCAKGYFLFVVLVAGLVAMSSCESNEISFFIKHVKALPDPPGCTYSVSDATISSVTVDLAFAPSLSNAYLVKNQLMAREDYDNLRAESNGIFVDYYDVSVTLASTNTNVGGTERINYNYYIAPESEDLIIAQTLSAGVGASLADDLGCLSFTATNYPEESVFLTDTRRDADGNEVGRSLGTAYSIVRFHGHTQGDVKVATQEFTFPVNLCCGCTINWNNCDNLCGRYCEDAEASKLCMNGVQNGDNLYDCRNVYHNLGATWDCLDDDGNPLECTCDNECSS